MARKSYKPASWSWTIPPDAHGNPIDETSQQKLLEGIGASFRHHLIRDEDRMPKSLSIQTPTTPLMAGTRMMVLENTRILEEETIEQIGVFLTGFCLERIYPIS